MADSPQKLFNSGTVVQDATGKTVYREDWIVYTDSAGDDYLGLVPRLPPPGLNVSFDREEWVRKITPTSHIVRTHYSTNGAGRLPPSVDSDDPTFEAISSNTRTDIFEVPTFVPRIDAAGGDPALGPPAPGETPFQQLTTWEEQPIKVEVPVVDVTVVVNTVGLSFLEIQSAAVIKVGQVHTIPVPHIFTGFSINKVDDPDTYQIRYTWTTHGRIPAFRDVDGDGTDTTLLPAGIVGPTQPLTVGQSYIRIPNDPNAGPPDPGQITPANGVASPYIRVITTSDTSAPLGYVGLPGDPANVIAG